jgi:hypothetical protein
MLNIGSHRHRHRHRHRQHHRHSHRGGNHWACNYVSSGTVASTGHEHFVGHCGWCWACTFRARVSMRISPGGWGVLRCGDAHSVGHCGWHWARAARACGMPKCGMPYVPHHRRSLSFPSDSQLMVYRYMFVGRRFDSFKWPASLPSHACSLKPACTHMHQHASTHRQALTGALWRSVRNTNMYWVAGTSRCRHDDSGYINMSST